MKKVFKVILLIIFAGVPYGVVSYPIFAYGLDCLESNILQFFTIVCLMLVIGVYSTVIYNWLSKYLD